MKQQLIQLSRRYATALRKHLQPGSVDLRPAAASLGRQLVALGLETLDLAHIHEQAVLQLELTAMPAGLTQRATDFFRQAMVPLFEAHHAMRKAREELARTKEMLGRRTDQLATSKLRLQQGIQQRERMEIALKESGDRYARLLQESLEKQGDLRKVTHRMLTAQENERHQVSRTLQNTVAQTLLGINVRLLSIRRQAQGTSRNLKKEIASTQQVVARSARSVRRVARRVSNA